MNPLLLAALRTAPRRYRMPPLPADIAVARASGTEAALAFAIDAARRGDQDAAVQQLFISALADLVRNAMHPTQGDAAFQALVLRRRHAQVEEHVRLAAQAAADRRAVRTRIDAVAHPGKLRALAPGPLREALAPLQALAADGAWTRLRAALESTLRDPALHASAACEALQSLLAHDSLRRLERTDALLADEAVQAYRALYQQQGPVAGSSAATASGRASARAGELAEQSTLQAFEAIATLLDAKEAGPHRAVRGLRTPRGFPGARDKTKDEWDAAILCGSELALLAEVKASPAAATADVTRLLRGLQRLALAADDVYAFPSADGEVRLAGASLRALQPHDHALPAHVIYCCTAPDEAPAPLLGAASKAVLLGEPGCLAHADAIATRKPAGGEVLEEVWRALRGAPRLRSVLHQYETACAAREAMLHPDDLLAAVRQALGA